MHHLLVIAFAIVSPLVFEAQPASVSGTWTVSASVSGSQSEQACTFTQKEAELSGTCKGERGAVSIAGKIDDKSVTWQFDIDYEGQKLTPVYTGTLETADKIVGSVDVRGMGVSGDFVATRAK